MLFDFDDRFALFDMTPVDNQFIQEYLPAARGDDVRVYLYGLMRCYHPEKEMSLAQMSHDLNLTEEEITRAYRYWERRGLVRRICDDPAAYRYISVRQRAMGGAEPQLDPDYEAFAESLYSVFDNGRRLHGAEIRTCYEWVEDLKLPPEAVLMLLKHMARTKGKNFSIQSAQRTATQMAQENIRTIEEAEAFLSRDEAVYQGTKAVLKRLGQYNTPAQDQLEMYRKWTQDWGFTQEAVLEACVEAAKVKPTMGVLEGVLKNIRERTAPGQAIETAGVLQAREEADGLKKVLRAMGGGSVTEESLNWYRRIRAEYSERMMLLAAQACGNSRGTLEDVEKMLRSWQEKGITTPEAAEKYIQRFREQGELLKELRKLWGLSSLTGTKNRDMVNRWETELGYAPALILKAAEAATGTERPMLYLDTILTTYAQKGIRTEAQIIQARESFRAQAGKDGKDGKNGTDRKPAKQVIAQQYSQRDYGGAEESVDEMMNRLGAGK